MNLRAVFHLISYVLAVIGLSIGFCMGISWGSGDPVSALQGLGAACGCVLVGAGALWLATRGPIALSRRDGFGIVTFGWLAAAVAGALPYVFTGVISSPVSAVFETMSGFTTTGASVLSHIEDLPRGVLFWRAMTHFYGGMGVLVLCIAILPFLGVGGMQLYRAEMPGPSKDRLTPRIASTAKLLWGIYVLMCFCEAALLRVGGMSWFDAFCHSFATMATGGFSTRSASVSAYNSLYIEIVIIFFMFLAGTNFALHYRALRGDVGGYFRDAEFRLYIGIWLGSCLLLTFNTWGEVYASFSEAMRTSFFQGTSIMTTTGFVSADFNRWPATSRALLVCLMFVGGCAGSTGGGMKNIRILVVLKKAVREFRLFIEPKAVLQVKINNKTVSPAIISHISAFVLVFILVFVVVSLIMSLMTPDMATAFSCVIATLGNIGPGLGAVGAVENYASIPSFGQALLTLCMLLGRLELYTVLVILLPSCWGRGR